MKSDKVPRLEPDKREQLENLDWDNLDRHHDSPRIEEMPAVRGATSKVNGRVVGLRLEDKEEPERAWISAENTAGLLDVQR